MKRGYPLVGVAKECIGRRPVSSRRVYFMRSLSGSPTIYLFYDSDEAAYYEDDDEPASETAFGWVSANHAKDIWLQHDKGWCNYYEASNTVVFTDNVGPATKQDRIGDLMQITETCTDFVRQSRGWRSDDPPDFGQQPPAARAAESKENHMAYAPQAPKALGFSASGVVASLVNNNKDGLQAAAYLEAGRIANNQLTKLASKSLPMMVRGYADTAVGKIVMANLAQQIIMQFRPQEPKLVKLSQAMVTEAMQSLIQTVDIEGFIDQLVGSADGQRALSKLPEVD